MLCYRAHLEGEVIAVLAVAVRARPAVPSLGLAANAALFRVTVRYTVVGGRVQVHRGILQADVPAGRRLTAAGYHLSGAELFISLRPVVRPEPPGGGVALTDRFRLPVGFQAWGVTTLQGAALELRAVCRGAGRAVLLRGALRLTLRTPGAPFRLRVPFCRVVAAEHEEGLRWRAFAGVTGLYLKVGPGGRVEGEAVVAVRYEGRPPGRQAGPEAPALHRVRELSGRVARGAAEPAGDGHALVQGLADLDLYWFDREGRSRWTGRQAPFGALVALPGMQAQDRLEVQAVLERLYHRVEGGEVAVHLVVAVTVTAVRPEVLALGGAPYRLERVVGSAAATIEAAERFFASPERVGGGEEEAVATLPLAGPAGGWQEVAAVLSTPEATAGAGAGRWMVRAALGGTPAGEAPYPAPLKAAASGSIPLGPRDVLTVVAGLEQLDPAGLRVRTALVWGLPLSPAAGAARGSQSVSARIGLPGPVRAVLAGEAAGEGPYRVRAIVAMESRGCALVEGEVDHAGGGPALGLLAVPVLHAGQWQLQVLIECAVHNA